MTRPTAIISLLSTLPLLLFTAGASAAVYKWVDEQGTVHFGDRPPHYEAKPLKVRPASLPPPSEAAAADQTAGGPAGGDGEKGGEGETEEQKNPERSEYCRRAQEDLKRYEAAERLAREDEQGNQVILDGAQREELLETVRQRIQRWCK